MNISFSVPHFSISDVTTRYFKFRDYPVISHLSPFPFCNIDKDSYVVNATIYSGLPYALHEGYACFNLQIGRFCSIADQVSFHLGNGHDYKKIAMGATKLLSDTPPANGKKQKGCIIIQNDVWIGHGVTVMPGVIIHNGAVVAADSHVIKDVPPYAIVGGNPARIIGYRFEEDIIAKLQSIQWWYWTDEMIKERAEYFTNDVELFCDAFYPEAVERENVLFSSDILTEEKKSGEKICLLIPDFGCSYAIYSRVIREFIDSAPKMQDMMLIIYILESQIRDYPDLCTELDKIASLCNGIIRIGLVKERDVSLSGIFKNTSHFIITRHRDTVRYTCMADYFGAKCISGVDEPIWQGLSEDNL